MRVERDKLPWLDTGPALKVKTITAPQLTRSARWWVTAALTSLDDTRTPAFRRLPFACTLACLSQVVRAVEDWLDGFDQRGEYLSSEVEDLAAVLVRDKPAAALQPDTVARILRLCEQTLKFISIRRTAADTRGPKQKRFTQIIHNDWGALSEQEACRTGPGRLGGLASELLTALTSTDDYRAQLQDALADALAADEANEDIAYWTTHFLRSMQVLGHSTPWLQARIGTAADLLAGSEASDHQTILAKSFPKVPQESSKYRGIVALQPVSTDPVGGLPGWMKALDWNRVASLVDSLPEGAYKTSARRAFADSSESPKRGQQFFEIAHKDVCDVASTPWGRYTDQFDAAWDIAAAVTSTLQNYWAGNPRRNLWMTPDILVHVPGQFCSFVSLEWRQKSENYPVRALYELPRGIESVFHWVHQSYEIPSPEASFLCAWIAAEKLVARSALRQSSGRKAPDAVMVEWLLPILLIEEVWSRLQEACWAIHALGVSRDTHPRWLVRCLLNDTRGPKLGDDCEPVPYLADELRNLSVSLRDPAVADNWLGDKAAQIRRNFHRMRRLRSQIVHNAELDPVAARFLSEVLADYVRIAAYRTATLTRSVGCPLDQAFGIYRRTYREIRAALQERTKAAADIWEAVLSLR